MIKCDQHDASVYKHPSNQPQFPKICLSHFFLLKICQPKQWLKINSNSTQNEFNPKIQSTYSLTNFSSNQPRFVKIYSMAFLLKNSETRKLPQNQFNMVSMTIGWCIAQDDLKLYLCGTRQLHTPCCTPNGPLWSRSWRFKHVLTWIS
jgi:hypothetical protein